MASLNQFRIALNWSGLSLTRNFRNFQRSLYIETEYDTSLISSEARNIPGGLIMQIMSHRFHFKMLGVDSDYYLDLIFRFAQQLPSSFSLKTDLKNNYQVRDIRWSYYSFLKQLINLCSQHIIFLFSFQDIKKGVCQVYSCQKSR